VLLNELTRPFLDLLVFTNLHRMLMKPQMHASTSHVSGSKYIIDSGTTCCNIDRWYFTDLADKGRPNRCRLSN
jgi:hypothetical protein